ncbi:homoserine O-acetyltransferase [Marinobacter daqiaonensis]|uniref:Homoserine O-acetyltransferase n=1 Tax=Marinobacter daqiaonensis TaxID=650891 RepID=A0A1I6IE69_9GAMM|nr:alpha/beta fold hydrolase [Marinobacter daqiaonensis]SFR64996.1 homoserine O-acetyltransferase [Marinobacter daqiaonensis]
MTDKKWNIHEFRVPELALSGGGLLPAASLIYHQIGELNAPKDNLVLLPTYYGGAAQGNYPLVGGDSPLDPDRYCIVIPAMLGAGESSSPSNTRGVPGGGHFPAISLYDNIVLQKRLVDDRFGGASIALVMGWSMGGMQALQWASAFPGQVRSVVASCCTARCSPHNWLFLEGVKAALKADPGYQNGHYEKQPEAGLKAFARVYAGWAYSQAFFRNRDYELLGFGSVEELLRFWERDHLSQDANDLLTVLAAWQNADVSDTPLLERDFNGALGRITMPTRVLPCRTDLYFTVEDAFRETAAMPGARLEVIESDWGHVAGGPGRQPQVMSQLFRAMGEVLSEAGQN